MSNETQKVVKDLFRLASADDITEHLASALSRYVEDGIDDGICENDGKRMAGDVYLHTSIINFFHKLEKANARDEIDFQKSLTN